MIEIASYIATAIAITGVILNNHRRRACFIVWLVSNSITLAIHLQAGLIGLGVRDAVFLALAVHGWLKWGKGSK